MLKALPWDLGIPEGTLSGLEKFGRSLKGSIQPNGTVGIMGTQEAEEGYDVIEAIAKMPWCSGNAIAPWEACNDLYWEQFVRGRVFDAGLFDFIIDHNIQGHGGIEDFHEMYRRYSTADRLYWKDKRPVLGQISISAYITASYASFVHTMGSLRIAAELASFFAHYLNGANNGWEQTPRVRTTILRFNQDPLYNVVGEDYPISRTEYRKMGYGG
ncbi:hypothetical protein BO70DRAFT_395135 [Aspergillus heteromorphus CBS 117.55]|uniref:Uncharacterized protein n=1 Tax=Aspergillus heteromorphus CBS 117.55 TaxID=1448321 RepID=A0A317WHS8_9EURO|nr:uncharacterized protein BO70DRAFT_395135 [Aspergillus heteromorphus CBS 117.55]PWY86006.1 hypothetical protein BO70DRAFT_395135 [Aspergillus heteromorphus CBS 117.55]